MFRKSFLHQKCPSECMYVPELLHALRYIPNLKYIPSSLKSDVGNENYDRKTDLQVTNNFDPRGEPDSPPPILLFEAKLGKPSIFTSHLQPAVNRQPGSRGNGS